MTEDQREAIHQLWDRLADFSVAETDRAQLHLMETIAGMIHAGNAHWLGSVRLDSTLPDDPLKGFRPRAYCHLHPAPIHDEAFRAQAAKWNRSESNEGIARAARDMGTFRAIRLRDVMRPAWFHEDYYQTFHASRGFHDQLFVSFPLHEDCESFFGFQRVGEETDFTAEEEAIASYALRGIKWFHRQLALSHGLLIAEAPLSPTQRLITRLLLTERSEKQIAEEVGRTPGMTHKHITEIFRKFGVNSRAGLMAVWLGQKAS